MTFKNYKIHNYSYNHALSAEDMNSLVSNDIILYNKIDFMPRGVLAFAQNNPYGTNSGQNPSGNFRQTFTKPSSPTNVDARKEAFSYKYILTNPGAATPVPLQATFSVESNRLIKVTGYLANLRSTDGSLLLKNIFRTAFFIKDYKDQWSLLNSSLKGSKVYYTGNVGSLTFSHVAALPAGEYSVRMGIKVHNTTAMYLGEDSSAALTDQSNGIVVNRPTQLVVEDIGGFIAQRAEVEYEFQD
jgi:hypothetical protein